MSFLKSLFGGGKAVEDNAEPSAYVAATALLVEAALADGIYANMEEERIRSILKSVFRMNDMKARETLAEAEELAEEAVDHYRFTKVVKEKLSLSERELLMEQLWTVVLADGERSSSEDSFIRRIGPLLAVEDRKRVVARMKAEAATDADTPD